MDLDHRSPCTVSPCIIVYEGVSVLHDPAVEPAIRDYMRQLLYLARSGGLDQLALEEFCEIRKELCCRL